MLRRTIRDEVAADHADERAGEEREPGGVREIAADVSAEYQTADGQRDETDHLPAITLKTI